MGKLNNNESASHYIHWCADMANKQNVGVPWIMCQQDDDVPPNVVINFPPSVITLVFLSRFVSIYVTFRTLYIYISTDQHVQRILLPRLVPQQDRHPKDLDGELDWLVHVHFLP
jgi:hypothetical protein